MNLQLHHIFFFNFYFSIIFLSPSSLVTPFIELLTIVILALCLNETCKNAMNITDFVSSIKLNFDDLENTGRCGYIEGISNIIFNKINKIFNVYFFQNITSVFRLLFY